MPTNTTIFKSP